MSTIVPAEERPEHFKNVAEQIRSVAARLDAIAELFHQLGIEKADIPLKRSAVLAIRSLKRWADAAEESLIKARLEAGHFGPDTTGQGPRAGKESPGSGRFGPRKKKKK